MLHRLRFLVVFELQRRMSDGTKLIAVIGDEDTVTGFILAGIGHRTAEGTNFLVVKSSASTVFLKGFLKLGTSLTRVMWCWVYAYRHADLRY